MISSMVCSILARSSSEKAAPGLGEVVIEAFVDRRTDGDLGARKEALHGVLP